MLPESEYRSRHGYRTIIAAFAVGLLVGTVGRELVRPADAQVPNAGQQRMEMSQDLSQLNAKMADVVSILRNGTLKVRVVETDKTSTGHAENPGTAPPPPPSAAGPGRAPVVAPSSR